MYWPSNPLQRFGTEEDALPLGRCATLAAGLFSDITISVLKLTLGCLAIAEVKAAWWSISLCGAAFHGQSASLPTTLNQPIGDSFP
jgi:hypothetical protein